MENSKNDISAAPQQKKDSVPPRGYREHGLYEIDPTNEGDGILVGYFYAPKGADLETLWEDYKFDVSSDCLGFNVRMFQTFADWLEDERGVRVIKSERIPTEEESAQ